MQVFHFDKSGLPFSPLVTYFWCHIYIDGTYVLDFHFLLLLLGPLEQVFDQLSVCLWGQHEMGVSSLCAWTFRPSTTAEKAAPLQGAVLRTAHPGNLRASLWHF